MKDNHKLIILHSNILIVSQFLEHVYKLKTMFCLCGTAAFSSHNRDQRDPESILEIHVIIQSLIHSFIHSLILNVQQHK